MEDIKLIPPFRFAIVEEGLFRGGYPNVKNFQFLQRLKLKTMISIVKKVTKEVEAFCENEGIHHLHYPSIGKLKDDDAVSPQLNSLIAEILEICIEPTNLPIYIHCGDGANTTGLVIMCLRKLQNWNLSGTYGEFTRFTKYGTILKIESQFVESFKNEVKIPPRIPSWLWLGVRATRHPTIRIKLIRGEDEWRDGGVLGVSGGGTGLLSIGGAGGGSGDLVVEGGNATNDGFRRFREGLSL